MKDRFILACEAYFVKQRAEAQVSGRKVAAHPRICRKTLPTEEISPHLSELAQHIACNNGKTPVHIPALNCAEWGHLLRSLETARGWA